MQLDPLDPVVAVAPRMLLSDLLLRTMPIWLTVLLLLLTRIPALPIKKVLQRCVRGGGGGGEGEGAGRSGVMHCCSADGQGGAFGGTGRRLLLTRIAALPVLRR